MGDKVWIFFISFFNLIFYYYFFTYFLFSIRTWYRNHDTFSQVHEMQGGVGDPRRHVIFECILFTSLFLFDSLIFLLLTTSFTYSILPGICNSSRKYTLETKRGALVYVEVFHIFLILFTLL